MTFTEKIRLKFNRKKCFQLILTHPDKSTSSHIVINEKSDYVEFNECRYTVVPEHVVYNRRLLIPVSFYHVNNSHPANPINWKSETITSSQVKKMMADKIVSELSSISGKKDEINKQILYAILGILTVGIIVLGYMMWNLQTLIESSPFVSEAFREWIKGQIAEGVFD